ncbi:MAG: 4-hydroxy-tetrahydrodipicolinate synthase [Planctomycetes bacterium]|jgi:4-hydroxy-tetrahydrodipicolinate synthase|nr:4-hydroxy-tetrahydrodipicolinate synthase [Planctomycetota bacterium]
MEFKGNYVALVTPFKNGKVDYDAMASHVEDQIRGGVAGLVPCGTTGESPTLAPEEHNQVVAEVVRMAAGRTPVIPGTGSNSTDEAIYMTRHAEEVGASAALVVAPYYNKPSQEGLHKHYTTLADATGLPIVVYNIPGRCAVEISLETMKRLAEHPRIAAVKEATGKLLNVSDLRRQTGLTILSGDDPLTLPMIALGGHGVISVISNLWPDRMTRLTEQALTGDLQAARTMHDQMFPAMQGLMSLATNPIPIKTALAIKGRMREEFRLPLCPMDAASRTALEALIA